MLRTLKLLLIALTKVPSSRRDLRMENLALRQQLAALVRKHSRPRPTAPDKLFGVVLRRIWSGWHSALAIAQPETVVRWHRARS
jgi:hypothetical protein